VSRVKTVWDIETGGEEQLRKVVTILEDIRDAESRIGQGGAVGGGRRGGGGGGGAGGFIALGATIGTVIVAAKAVSEAVERVGRTVVGVGRSIVGATSDFEVIGVQFETILGSASAAQVRLEELAEFAAKTPFEMEGIARADRLLQIFGGDFLATGDNLRLTGDIAASVNTDFAELAMWVGRMYDALQSGRPWGEAAMRLQELGVMSGAVRSNLTEMTEQGRSGIEVWGEFARVMDEQFGGGMERLAKTSQGLFSTLRDEVTLLKVDLGKGGILDLVKINVEETIRLLGSLREGGQATSIGESLTLVLISVNLRFLDLVDTVSTLGDEIDGLIRISKKFLGIGIERPEAFSNNFMGKLLSSSAITNPSEQEDMIERAFASTMTFRVPGGPAFNLPIGVDKGLDRTQEKIQGATDKIRERLEELAEEIRSGRHRIKEAIDEGAGKIQPSKRGGGGGAADFIGPELPIDFYAERNKRELEEMFQGPPVPEDLYDNAKLSFQEYRLEVLEGWQEMGMAGEMALHGLEGLATGVYQSIERAARMAGETERLTRLQGLEVVKFVAKSSLAFAIDALVEEAKRRAALEVIKLLGGDLSAGARLAGYSAFIGVTSAISASVRASAEREFMESLPARRGSNGRDISSVGSTGGGRTGTTSRSGVSVAGQAAVAGTLNLTVNINHYGGTVYGRGGIKEMVRAEVLEEIQRARDYGEI